MGILAAIVGLMMIAAPADFIRVTVILVGLALIVNGFVNLITVRKLILDPAFRLDITIRGWTSLLIGILAIALPLVFAAAMWTVMLYVLAVYLVISVIMEIYAAVKLHGAGVPCSVFVWEIVISLLIAAVLFAMPLDIGLFMVRIGGGVVAVASVCLLIYSIKHRDIVEEAESVEDADDSSGK
jgi:uncharacterized membrane protein HdeD (DUF308 family)